MALTTGGASSLGKMTVQALLVLSCWTSASGMLGFPRVFLLVDRWGRRRSVSHLRLESSGDYGALEPWKRCALLHAAIIVDVGLSAASFDHLHPPAESGCSATLRIGVKRYPFGAHAWVECLGEVLDDSTDDWRHEPYVPILRPASLSSGPRGFVGGKERGLQCRASGGAPRRVFAESDGGTLDATVRAIGASISTARRSVDDASRSAAAERRERSGFEPAEPLVRGLYRAGVHDGGPGVAGRSPVVRRSRNGCVLGA